MIAVQRATPIVRLMPVITALMASLSVGAANPAVMRSAACAGSATVRAVSVIAPPAAE
jgi:hypothetical protein